jgi:hypothetical protein
MLAKFSVDRYLSDTEMALEPVRESSAIVVCVADGPAVEYQNWIVQPHCLPPSLLKGSGPGYSAIPRLGVRAYGETNMLRFKRAGSTCPSCGAANGPANSFFFNLRDRAG